MRNKEEALLMATLRRSWRTLAGLAIALFLAAVAAIVFFPQQGVGHEGPDEEHRTIPQPAHPVELQITLGIKDTVQDPWEGSIKVSEGKILDLAIVQASRDSTVSGTTFNVKVARQAATKKKGAKNKADSQKPDAQKKKKKKKQDAAADEVPLVPVRLRAFLDAPDSATVSVESGRGNFSINLGEIK